MVAGTILKQGWVVGTFNFRYVGTFGTWGITADIMTYRGAGSSKGRTSWQSKAEQNDYISFIGFMVYYMHHLSIPRALLDQPKPATSEPRANDLHPIPSQSLPTEHLSPNSGHPSITLQLESDYRNPPLLLAGYSYGALITCSLPAILGSIIAPFQSPTPGSAHAEIRLRAQCLADQQNDLMQRNISLLLQARSHQRGRSLQADDVLRNPKTRGGVRMGGEEDPRRASHESHRSRSSFTLDRPELVRKSVDRVRSLTRSSRFSPRRQDSSKSFSSAHGSKTGSTSSVDREPRDEGEAKAVRAIPGVAEGLQTAYLLVSPLQGWINTLATMGSMTPMARRAAPENETKLAISPSLALFGDSDVFVSVRRLRAWAGRLAGAGEGGRSQFRYVEVANAGHFWHDEEALRILQEQVRDFAGSL